MVNPSGEFYYYWTGVVTMAVLYNILTVIMRAVFNDLQEAYFVVWTTLDYVCDLIYIIDMAVKFRTGKKSSIAS